MGSRYLFIVCYALIEKLLSRGDYRRTDVRRIVTPAAAAASTATADLPTR
jgi:hypothetical protein